VPVGRGSLSFAFALNICEASVSHLLKAENLLAKILKRFLDFWKFF
jgi:hypothetical protein